MGITITWLNQKIASGKIATAEKLSDGTIRPYGALSNIRRASVKNGDPNKPPEPIDSEE